MSKPKAVVLFSGGLDSILAVKLLEEQGITTIPIHCVTPFTGDPSPEFRRRMEREYGVKGVITKDLSLHFIPLLQNPPHGFGSQMNPCIDCKILFLKAAKELMEETGARFIATGEVVGQRPFSQRKDAMRIIEREAGVEGLLLRPLSAKLLDPTVPEEEGWVERERLLDIQGRGRKVQMELAKRYGLKRIPSPAGGCLLTDPGYSRRLKALMPILERSELEDTLKLLEILRIGRLFKVEECLLVVGRNSREADLIFQNPQGIKLRCKGSVGVLLSLREPSDQVLNTAARIVARYSRGVEGESAVEYERLGEARGRLNVTPMPPEEVEEFLIK